MQSVESLLTRLLGLFSSPAGTNRTGSGTNADVTLTLSAEVGKRSSITSLSWSYSDAPTGGSIIINDGANPVFRVDVTAAGPGFLPVLIEGSAGAVMTVTLTAGGADVVGRLNIQAREA